MHRSVQVAILIPFLPLFLHGSQEKNINIRERHTTMRQIREKDLPAVAALTRSLFYNDLKPIILEGYADNPIVQAGQTDAILEDWIAKQNAYAQEVCQNNNNDEKQLIVFKKARNIVGVCYHEKKATSDENITYIHFLGVDPNCRKQGIGTSLLFHTKDPYDDLDGIELTTLAHANKSVQEFYEKRGFSNQGLTTIDPRVENTHYLYQLKFNK